MESDTSLPTGTITLLLTDIEGSTRLWEEHPEQMGPACARHHALLTDAIEAHGGLIIPRRGEGDSFFAVFTRATDAVAAADQLQRALFAEPWPALTPIRVRAGIHTGEVELRRGDYYGSSITRCVRIRSLGTGGQTLLGRSTCELVRDALPPRVTLRDLGSHQLKDLQRPEQVYQLLHPDLPADFPPLKSLNQLPHNLPIQLTSFIGRESEMEEVQRLLGARRLLTLTGAGGTGKTRLALQVAAELLGEYREGAWFVDLGPLTEGERVPQAVAAVLSVREEAGRPALQTLVEALQARTLLLVLDNCEHLLPACAELVTALLRRCPGVRVLATSREAINVEGEALYRLPSLSLPDLRPSQPGVESMTQYEAVRLFIERARTSHPSFTVTNANAPALAELCHRLDGIPLALELAAARVRVLSVEQLRTRLDDRFRLLTGSSRAALPRHQTLRAAIDWSYDLLTEAERVLLRRLSVFVGGFTLEAAEEVCSNAECGMRNAELGEEAPSSIPHSAFCILHSEDVLDLLASLVDKSLAQQDAEGRFGLLETIRAYALERLREGSEHSATAERHAAWAVTLAEEGETGLRGPDQVLWQGRLAHELDNFRAAMEWSLSGQDGEIAEGGTAERSEVVLVRCRMVEVAGRLAGALARFFHWRGYVTEGRGWLEQALSAGAALSAATRARLLLGAALLCHEQAEGETARRYAEESLEIYRQLDDSRGVAAALEQLGHIVNLQDDVERAVALFEESLATSRASGDRAGMAAALNALGYMAWFNEEHARATTLCEESLRLRRELGDLWGIAYSLEFLGLALVARGAAEDALRALAECLQLRRQLDDKRGVAAALMQLGFAVLVGRDPDSARRYFEESLPLWREVNNPDNTATVLSGLGAAHRGLGEYARSAAFFIESLFLFQRIAMPWGIAECLEGLATTARAAGELQRSLRFAALAEATREADPLPLKEWQREQYARLQAAAAAALGEGACTAAWAEGRSMSLEQAIAEAREIAETTSPGGPPRA
jgi:predicted ATPase/class 3 adenylate cyclase